MNVKKIILLFAIIAFAKSVSAEAVMYGSFQHYSNVPNALFLTGEIKENDSFELRRAMRDQTINLVVTSSPGGNLYEGLQIAAILNDNEISTYIPEGASCESSCANVFLGGFRRMVIGEIGVHQFFAVGDSAASPAPKNLTTATTQYTTSEIIGIMNQLNTPPFVYEKMFGTVEIYYFKASEKPQLNLNIDDDTFVAVVAEIDRFLENESTVLKREPVSRSKTIVEELPAAVATPLEPASPTLEEEAFSILASINRDWSLPNEQALPRISGYYAAYVDFYGKTMTYAQVIEEKKTFAFRWPVRTYQVEPGTVRVDCTQQGCVIDSVISWAAASPDRGANASGRSTWVLILTHTNVGLRITSENGKTFSRD